MHFSIESAFYLRCNAGKKAQGRLLTSGGELFLIVSIFIDLNSPSMEMFKL